MDLTTSRPAIVLLSGGLDSATVLAMAKAHGYTVHALSFRYGQRHVVELEHAYAVAQQGGVASHHVIDVDLRAFGGSALTADIAVPKWQWAIAVDHVTWHGGRVDAQRDKENDRQARMIGWQVDRVTDDDIDHRLEQVTSELMTIARHFDVAAR